MIWLAIIYLVIGIETAVDVFGKAGIDDSDTPFDIIRMGAVFTLLWPLLWGFKAVNRWHGESK